MTSKKRTRRQPVQLPAPPVEPPDRVGAALVLVGLVSVFGELVTPATWLWLRLFWVACLVLASAWGSMRAWRRRRITIPGRYGGSGTVFTGLEAQLWAAVFGVMSAAIALGAVLHWLIDQPSERMRGLETVLTCGGLAMAFSLLGVGAVREIDAKNAWVRRGLLVFFLMSTAPLLLLVCAVGLGGAYSLATGRPLHW